MCPSAATPLIPPHPARQALTCFSLPAFPHSKYSALGLALGGDPRPLAGWLSASSTLPRASVLFTAESHSVPWVPTFTHGCILLLTGSGRHGPFGQCILGNGRRGPRSSRTRIRALVGKPLWGVPRRLRHAPPERMRRDTFGFGLGVFLFIAVFDVTLPYIYHARVRCTHEREYIHINYITRVNGVLKLYHPGGRAV